MKKTYLTLFIATTSLMSLAIPAFAATVNPSPINPIPVPMIKPALDLQDTSSKGIQFKLSINHIDKPYQFSANGSSFTHITFYDVPDSNVDHMANQTITDISYTSDNGQHWLTVDGSCLKSGVLFNRNTHVMVNSQTGACQVSYY